MGGWAGEKSVRTGHSAPSEVKSIGNESGQDLDVQNGGCLIIFSHLSLVF